MNLREINVTQAVQYLSSVVINRVVSDGLDLNPLLPRSGQELWRLNLVRLVRDKLHASRIVVSDEPGLRHEP